MKFRVLIFLTLLLFSFSCKTTKEVSNISLVSLDSQVLLNDISSIGSSTRNAFFKKCSFNLKQGSKDNSFTGSIFIQKDSFIIISLQALLGIEVARIKLSPEHIIVIDRFNKSVSTLSYKKIGAKFGIDLKYKSIELLLLNKPFDLDSTPEFLESNSYSSIITESAYLLSYKRPWSFFFIDDNNTFNHELMISTSPYKLIRNYINSPTSKCSLQIDYKDFDTLQGILFPTHLLCTGISANSSVVLDISFNTINFDVSSGINFSIPTGYEMLTK